MSSDSVKEYAETILKQRIASICLGLGWNSTQSSPMNVMQDILIRYIKMIGVNMKERAELCNRTEPNTNDLERTFHDLGISFGDLSEYLEQFDTRAVITDPVPIFPQPSETRLNHLKPGSREVLHRPYHIYDYLPPMYPEMESTEDETTTHHMDHDGHEMKSDMVKSESNATEGGVGDSSDLHPLREMASVMMTSSGFISPAREGRMADSRTPAVSRLATNNLNVQETPSRAREPQGPTKAKPSKPTHADDTSDEGIIESDDDFTSKSKPAFTTPVSSAAGGGSSSKLSVFQKNKGSKKKAGKAEKNTATPSSTEKVKKAGPGRPRGRKKKVEIAPTSKELVSSSDSDSSPERKRMTKPGQAPPVGPPPAKKVKVEPPVELNVNPMPAPDPHILPNNPLIPKYFGFDNLNTFENVSKDSSSSKKDDSQPAPVSFLPPTSSTSTEKKEESKKEKKKDKALKKAKKEKKEKNRDKERKDGKSEKKDKEKKKKKEKHDRPSSPILFAGTDQKTTTASTSSSASSSVPKLKIKEFKEADIVKPQTSSQPPPQPPPKIVFKNLESKKKEAPKQADLFSDSIHIDRPKSAASDSSDHLVKSFVKKEKKEASSASSSSKKSSDERKRSTSGGGKRAVEKRGSAIAAEAAIHAHPEESVPDTPGTPTFGGGSVETQTVGYYVDAEGNQIWICPACGKPDDGSPMIGCDECDDWYHWICVGIQQEPADNQDWFCPRCVAKKQNMFSKSSSGKRGRPPKLR